MKETQQPQEPALDPELAGKDQQRRGQADSPALEIQEIVASVVKSSDPAYATFIDWLEPEHVTQFLTQTHEYRQGRVGISTGWSVVSPRLRPDRRRHLRFPLGVPLAGA